MTARYLVGDVHEQLDTLDWRIWPYGYAERFYAGHWISAEYQQVLSAAIVRAVYGKKRKLIVNMPPRHGKSELLDLWGPVWYLDLNPEMRVMLVTYGQDLSDEWAGKARDVLQGRAEEFRVRVSRDSTAKKRWFTTRGGGMYAVGIDSTITGRGGNKIIIDDPHKDWREAQSQVQRDNIWDQYLGTITHRLEPGPDGGPGAEIVVQTRWHEDDFTGRLTAADPDAWEHLVIPAIAERDDPLGRAEGEPLMPERFPIERLRELEERLGPHIFSAVFQQHPSAPLGAIFHRSWWQRYEFIPPGIEQWLGSWDMAFKDNDDSDYVVGQVWARQGANLYLIDQVRDRMDFPATKKAVKALAAKWPRCSAWVIEDKANGPAIIAELRNTVGGLLPFSPRDSKEARAHAVAPHVASGNCYLPGFAWVQDLIDEAANFPFGVNDDQVDAFTQAAIHMGVASPILVSETYQDARLKGRR